MQIECRSRPWLIEPSNGNKFLYVRLKAIFLSKHNPKKALNATHLETNSWRCETKSRAVLTTSEGKLARRINSSKMPLTCTSTPSSGLTIVACPLSPDSSTYEFVEIFSSGWNERPNFALINRSRAISVEFLRPSNGEYSFNWMELVPRPTLSIAGATQ